MNLGRNLLIAACAAWVAFWVLVGYAASAYGHDHWINHEHLTDPVTKEWCCNTNDCREEPDNVQALPGGDFRIISTGEVIPAKRIIWRSPGGWWRCRNLTTGATRCIIGPYPGS